jgi:integrative and conjugative element protein (TIGR02256 family)
MPRALILAQRDYRSLELECLANTDTEIGRALVGKRLNDVFVVPFMIPAGPRAKRTSVRFSPDYAWQQVILDLIHKRFGLDYVGDIHTHPGLFDRPSEHDLRTARHIVTDRKWNKSEALFPIAVIDGSEVRVRAYLMRRETQQFEEVPIEIVPDTDPRMMAVLFGQDGDTTKEVSLAKKDRPGSQPGCRRIRRVLRRAAAGLRRLSRV